MLSAVITESTSTESGSGSPLSLEIIEGPGAGLKLPLRGPLVIGSGDGADVVLDSVHTSGRHTRVTPEGAGAMVEDLGSEAGTFVNGSRLHGPTRISPRDELQVGLSVFVLRTPAEVARRQSAVITVPPVLAAAPSPPHYIARAAIDERAGRSSGDMQQLERLLDANTRFSARTAPLAVLVLVALVVAIYLGAR